MACVDVNFCSLSNKFLGSVPTVDGRNPANQLIWRIYHYLHAFIHLRWSFGISEPSTVPVVVMFVKFTISLLHHFHSALTRSSQTLKQTNMSCHRPRTVLQAVSRQKPALQKIQKHFSIKTDVLHYEIVNNNCLRGL